jgi:hypothetical protein
MLALSGACKDAGAIIGGSAEGELKIKTNRGM